MGIRSYLIVVNLSSSTVGNSMEGGAWQPRVHGVTRVGSN